MTKRPHLAKAPIQEALIDIRAVLPAGTQLRQLDAVRRDITDQYPKRRTRKRFGGRLEVRGENEVVFAEQTPIEDGYLFHSRDGTRIIQARLDGFTFTRLRPYATWEEFRDEAKQHWARYIDVAHPESVERVSLRYINRMEFPIPFVDFKDYVLTVPDIAPGLPSAVQNLFLRLEVPYPSGASR